MPRQASRLLQTASIKDGPVEATISHRPFQVRGRFFTAVVLRIMGEVDKAFHDAIDALMRQSPQFFFNAPIVLDLAEVESLESKADFLKLVRELRSRKLFAVGVQNATDAQSTGAFQAGLVTLQGGRDADLPRSARTGPVEAAAPSAPEPPARPSLLITEPVRSGQRIFADKGDLVVVASVSSGAELIAHGNIHAYGPLRGRALAGVNGDTNARIFCQSLQADLVAIAGLYQTSDDLGPAVFKQRIQAFLKDDALCVEPLK